jgi:hypothetical protein
MKADSRRGPRARKDQMIVLDDADLETRRNSVTLQELLRSRWCRWAQRSSVAPTWCWRRTMWWQTAAFNAGVFSHD